MKTNLTDRPQIASEPSLLIERLSLAAAVRNRLSILRKDLCRFPARARLIRVSRRRHWIGDLQENRRASGRRIWVASQSLRDSTFYFALPEGNGKQ